MPDLINILVPLVGMIFAVGLSYGVVKITLSFHRERHDELRRIVDALIEDLKERRHETNKNFEAPVTLKLLRLGDNMRRVLKKLDMENGND